MRTLLVGVVLGLACGATAAEDKKIDDKKLVGKWLSKTDKGQAEVEFTKDGKTHLTFTTGTGDDKKEFKVDGTYKVDGNKLTTTSKVKDQERSRVVTITKLTDDELETAGEEKDGKAEKRAYKKVKP